MRKFIKAFFLKVIEIIRIVIITFIKLSKHLFSWKTVERIKLVFEVIAIPVAAYWAYTLFIESDAPSLAPRSNLSSEIIWTEKTDRSCRGELRVEFQNIGKKNLDIGKAHLTSWFLNKPTELNQSEKFKLIDPRSLREGTPLFDEDTDIFEYSYPPDEKIVNTFIFEVVRAEKKQILITVGMWDKKDLDNNLARWNFDTWDWVCGENPFSEESKPQ